MSELVALLVCAGLFAGFGWVVRAGCGRIGSGCGACASPCARKESEP